MFYLRKIFLRVLGHVFSINENVNKAKYVYAGGFHSSRQNIFDILEEYDIVVSKHERVYRFFIVFDCEALLESMEEVISGMKLRGEACHIPISASVCSNIDGYREAKCFVNEDSSQLVEDMIEYDRT